GNSWAGLCRPIVLRKRQLATKASCRVRLEQGPWGSDGTVTCGRETAKRLARRLRDKQAPDNRSADSRPQHFDPVALPHCLSISSLPKRKTMKSLPNLPKR